jgi:hypothetical protein
VPVLGIVVFCGLISVLAVELFDPSIPSKKPSGRIVLIAFLTARKHNPLSPILDPAHVYTILVSKITYQVGAIYKFFTVVLVPLVLGVSANGRRI